jgi:hypothetical protein
MDGIYPHCSNNVKPINDAKTCNGNYILIYVLIITYEQKKMLMGYQENEGKLMAPPGICRRTGVADTQRSDG